MKSRLIRVKMIKVDGELKYQETKKDKPADENEALA
ncbi:hypothetical protein [Aggregatibacter actinomycetemcomitans]|nr:hypothetical protein CF65_00666 [Aggregatibacter actinomycetemcomitans HK1651]